MSQGPSRSTQQVQALIEGPITSTLARFSWPLLVSNLLHALLGTWAAFWVSRELDANALTAVVTANVFMYMMIGSAMGIGMAAGVAVGQSLGAGNLLAVRRVVGTSISMVLLLSSLVAVAGWIFTPNILDALGMPIEARDYGITHLRFTCLVLPIQFCYIVMMMVMRASGDSRNPLRFSLIWIGLSLFLSPTLLTGAFGFPKLGIAGIALGNLIANATALLALVAFVYVKRLPIALRGEDLKHLKPDPLLTGLLIRRGLPMALESLIVQGAYFALLSMVNRYGAVTAAAYSGAAQVWSYVQMPANALSSSMAAMVAMNVGAKRWDRVEQIAWKGSLLSLGIATSLALMIYAAGDLPLLLFIPKGGEVLSHARSINNIVLWGWVALSVSLGIFGVLRGNGSMVAPTLIFALAMWLFRVPFARLLEPMIGANAIWWSFPFGSICAAVMAFGFYRWGGWRRNAPMLEQPPASADDGKVGE